MEKKSRHTYHYHITIVLFFQNSEILSRKSSASSTGSLDRNNEKLKSCGGGRGGRNTPQIANSVKAKIAMFSSSPPAPSSMSSSSSSCTESQSLTRSLTHTDVRYEDQHHSDSNSGLPGSKNNHNLETLSIPSSVQ